MAETTSTNMKIQSCTAKILKYPALATVAAMVGALSSCGQQGEQPQAPRTEKQAETQSPTQTTPQPSAGVVAPEAADQQPEEMPDEILGGAPPLNQEEMPEILGGDVPYIPEEEEETTVETPTVIPQNAVGSVPCPPQEQNK